MCKQFFPSLGKETLYPTLQSAILAQTPTLQFFDRVYGKGQSLQWLEVQIREVLVFTGLLDKMSTYQRFALANSLRTEAVDCCVTMSEMMVFFSRFERGKYKRFVGYERPNPQVVTESFDLFLVELTTERQKAYAEQKKKDDAQFYQKMREEAVPPPEEIKKKWEEIFGKETYAMPKEEIKLGKKDNRMTNRYLVKKNNGEVSPPLYPREVLRYTEGLEPGSYEIIEYNDNEQEEKD